MVPVVLRCLILITSLFLSASVAQGEDFDARVIGVTDGDTIVVLHDGYPQKVRLAEIDCPEKSQPFGRSARSFTSEKAFGKDVHIESSGQDRYGRTIGTVVLPDGTSLNSELVREGYAWQYRHYSKNLKLSELEAQARQSQRGLWQDPNATAPWDYRHLRKRTAHQRY